MLDNEAYNVVVTAELKKSDIVDESEVTCVVEIPNSDYMTRKTITYDGMKSFHCCSHNLASKFSLPRKLSGRNNVQMSMIDLAKINILCLMKKIFPKANFRFIFDSTT